MELNPTIAQAIQNTIETKKKILENRETLYLIEQITEEVINAFKNDKKVLLCGNGGSAADAQHISGELSVKLCLDREPLFAESLTTNTSHITAVANDLSFDDVFARLVKAQGREGDILIAISTSGKSRNIVKAIEVANKKGMIVIGLTGEDGRQMNGICKHLIKVPSNNTQRIQESHILIGHIMCEIVEKRLFG